MQFKYHSSSDQNTKPIFQSPEKQVKFILTQLLTQHVKAVIILTWNQYKKITEVWYFFSNEAFEI